MLNQNARVRLMDKQGNKNKVAIFKTHSFFSFSNYIFVMLLIFGEGILYLRFSALYVNWF